MNRLSILILLTCLVVGCSPDKVVMLRGVVLTGKDVNNAGAGVGHEFTIIDDQWQRLSDAKVTVLTPRANPKIIATTTTGPDGRYQMELSAPQEAVLKVEKAGFKTVEREITIAGASHFIRNTIILAPASQR